MSLHEKKHLATGEHYAELGNRWQAWCDDCGKEIHGYEFWVPDYGPYLVGWFHEDGNSTGKDSLCGT